MVGETEEVKRDEQCPLLKMEVGDLPQTPPTMISPGWNVACKPKRSWLNRWPEYISACWMTLILLGITVLVFYAFGMNGFKRKPLIIVKYNNSKPENNVFFHQIIPRDTYLRFTLYSDYLSNMAVEYPFLQINVVFMVDDSLHNSIYRSKHSIFKRFGPSITYNTPVPISDKDEMELKIFQQRHRNVNVSIIPLSHYMAMTPLRYKWKMIPIFYLPFYARIFAVWEYGGIGMDLTTFNNQYNIYRKLDRRIAAVLKQHNDGIEEKRYVQALNTINREEEIEFFNIFDNLITSVLNNTYSFFDNPLYRFPANTENNRYAASLSRNYRNINRNSAIHYSNSTGVIFNDSSNLRSYTTEINKDDLYGPALTSTFNFANFTKNVKNPTLNIEKHATVDQSKDFNKKLENQLATSYKNRPTNWYWYWVMNSTLDNVNDENNTVTLETKDNSTSNGQITLKNISGTAAESKSKIPNEMGIDLNGKRLNSTNTSTNDSLNDVLSAFKNNNYSNKNKKKLEIELDINTQHKDSKPKIATETPHLVLFYDFSILSDGIGPSYFLPEVHPSRYSSDNNILREPVENTNRAFLLSVASDGTFVAATARRHPFLGHILSSGCKRVNPKFAIEDTVFSQCSGFTRNDVYCDTIYILD